MSASNVCFADAIYFRSQFVKAGLKKAAKTRLSRVKRQQSKQELTSEVVSLKPPRIELHLENLHELSQAQLDSYADMFLADAPTYDDELFEEFDPEAMACGEDESHAIPLHLQGSLPDWMLNELEASNGDAFAALSLFEAKRVSPKAAISMEDEALYA